MKFDKKKLVCAMIDCDYTTKELANVTGLRRETITRAKNNVSVNDETFGKICKALNKRASELIAD